MAIHLHDKRIRLWTTLFILCLAAILCVSAGLHAQQSKQTASPKHCLWLVETPLNKAVFLLGSLHVLKSDAYPLAKEINEAYGLSQKVVFETDLAAMARGAGIKHVADVGTTMEFGEAVLEAIERDAMSVIVARVRAVGPDNYGMDLHLPENAFRFRRQVQGPPMGRFVSGWRPKMLSSTRSGGP